MDIKTFTTLLLVSIVVLQIAGLALTFYLHNLYGPKGTSIGLIIAYLAYLALFVGLRKAKVEENGSPKSMSNLGDFFAMIPWVLTAIVVLTVVGIGAGIRYDRENRKSHAIIISLLNTGLIFFGMFMSTKIVKGSY